MDDNAPDRLACRRVLQARSWSVEEAETPEAALAAMDAQEFHAVLSDYNLKSAKDGVDVLAHAFDRQPSARRVLMSGFFTPGVVERARERARIHAWFDKPMSPADWALDLERALPLPVAPRD